MMMFFHAWCCGTSWNLNSVGCAPLCLQNCGHAKQHKYTKLYIISTHLFSVKILQNMLRVLTVFIIRTGGNFTENWLSVHWKSKNLAVKCTQSIKHIGMYFSNLKCQTSAMAKCTNWISSDGSKYLCILEKFWNWFWNYEIMIFLALQPIFMKCLLCDPYWTQC